MAKKPEELARLYSVAELDDKIADVEHHMNTRADRAKTENRSFTAREDELNASNAAELDVLNRAIVVRQAADDDAEARRLEREARDDISDAAIEREQQARRSIHEGRSRQRDQDAIEQFTELVRSLQPGQVELRAATTSNSGAKTGVDGNAGNASMYLHDSLGMRVQEAQSLSIQGPYFAALASYSATSEGGTKPVMGDPTLKTATLAAYAQTFDVTDQTARFGVGLDVFARRIEAGIAFSINAALVAAAVTEGGSALAFSGSLGAMLDKGIATSAAKTGHMPSGIVVNSADYPAIATKTGADSAEDIASQVVRWNGVNIYVNDAVTAGFAVIVDGQGWTVHQSGLIAKSQPILASNKLTLLGERYWTCLPHYAGAAVYVDIVTP